MECRSLREYKKKKELGTKREKTKEGTEERKRSPFFFFERGISMQEPTSGRIRRVR